MKTMSAACVVAVVVVAVLGTNTAQVVNAHGRGGGRGTAAPAMGTVEKIVVHGKSLEGNLEGDSPDREATVYLPPTYASDPSRRRSIRETLHRAAAVVAVSRPLARLAEELGADPSRVHWIPNGVDRTEFHPRSRSDARRTLGWDPGRPSVLFVGRLDPIKGVRLLLESIEELRRAGLPDVACYLAGDGPLRGEIGRRVAERGLERTVILLGPVRPDRLALCYAAADLLCLPSVSEGSPNVVLESLATGTPVVAADVGDVAELLEGAAGGAVVRERTAPGFAEGMRSVLARSWNPETTAAIVASRGWDRVAAAQIGVYRSVLGAA